MRAVGTVALGLPLVGGGWATSRPDAEAPDFATEVLPVLSDKCFVCHGPDPTSRRASLRLDDETAARESGVFEGGTESEFAFRISSDDPAFAMPPAEVAHGLTAAERETLLAWVRAGGEYEPHWAFVPLPDEVPVPEDGEGWARSPIDRFVARGHAREGSEPAPAASGWRWLRRVTFDLTGLPPTPAEIRSFRSDDSPSAKEAVVDRLLASKAFGERMATMWLDVARYADSYGYQSDQLAPHWPYRDWVVGAFNDGMPFDAFLQKQVAGDLLPDATLDDRLATAFNRLHRMTNEGGSVEAEWRNESICDRVETLGTAVLGLTLGCARCHDHKYDPISQREFYALYAYFNSIDEWGLYHDSARVPTPSLFLPTDEQSKEIQRLDAEIDDLRATLRELSSDATGAPFFAQEAGPDPLEDVRGDRVVFLGFEDREEVEGVTRFRTSPGKGAMGKIKGTADLVPRFDRSGKEGLALRLDGDTPLVVEGVGSLGPADSFTIALVIELPAGLEDCVIAHQSGGTDVGYFGFDLVLAGGRLRARHVRFWPGNAVAIETVEALPTGRPVHVTYTQLGSGTAEHMRLFVDGAERTRVLSDRLSKPPGGPSDDLWVGARFRDRGLAGARVDRLEVWSRAVTPLEVLFLQNPEYEFLKGHTEHGAYRDRWPDFQLRSDPQFQRAVARLENATRERYELLARVTEVSVMEEAPDAPRAAHVLDRGDYDAPKDEDSRVDRGVPRALDGSALDQPEDRLELARWLTSESHPLTSRVAVNRFWQVFFGTGLVATPADFGLQGARPTHPELLDWLARDFVASGWDVKALCRSICLSRTYGQDSAVPPEARSADPENVWLTRGPSMRLSAEMLRDAALASSGLLVRELGGPPVSPYQPDGLWRENNTMSPAYVQSTDEGLWRRSLYSVVKRTAPLPNMTAFDAPMRETSCARREVTSTPLQGLTLLGDVQFVEAARALAERALAADDPIADAFTRLTGRSPDRTESRVLAELFEGEREVFEEEPDRAAQLVATGSSDVDEGLDVVRLAALTVVCQTILNLDAFVQKR